MTNLFGIKAGTPKVCARLLSEILDTRFRKTRIGGSEAPWYVAERDGDAPEVLVLLSNSDQQGKLIEPYAAEYEVLLFIDHTDRPEVIAHALASQTTFRYLEPSDRVRAQVHRLFHHST